MSNIAGYILQNAQAQLGAIAMIDHSLARYQKSRSRHLDQYGYSLKEVSYQTFTNRFSRLAAGIRALDGICPKDRIIICMENRPEYLDILLACWCAGLCVVPVNAKLHAKEILHIVSDSAARLVLVDEAYAEELSQLFIEAH
jgi:acyl-CoA synthetase (AMP-forming)/AMP-acid ligase II